MRSFSKPRPSIRQTTGRRYSARYLILIYREARANFDPLEIQRLVAREQAKCTIVRHSQDDNFSRYFAFVDFAGKRFQTRNLGLFDVQGYHPKWVHVTSSPWRTLDEMVAQGDVVWNGIVRPSKNSSTGRKKHTASKMLSSSNPWELIGSANSEASFQELLRKEMKAEESEPQNSLFDDLDIEANSTTGETEMARNVQYWQDGYRAGYKAAISKSNIHQITSNAISRNPEIPPCDGITESFPSNDSADFDDDGSTCCSQSQVFTATDAHIQRELSQLDWNLELDDIWNPQRVE